MLSIRRLVRKRIELVLIAMVAILLATAVYAWGRGTSFVVRAGHVGGLPGTVANWFTGEVVEQDLSVPSRSGPLRARLYRPAGRIRRAAVLAHGVHFRGIDEERLVPFARELAKTGLAVLTPELPDLMRYRITARSTDQIEDAALWLARRTDLAAGGRIGLMGLSFAGGLAIVAASRPSLRERATFVFSFGGHGDLPRVLRFLCSSVEPGGAARRPHPYGVAVILLAVAERLVPAAQVEPLRAAIAPFLRLEFDEARRRASALPEPSRTLAQYVNTRDVRALGPILEPYLGAFGTDAVLSPERSEPPRAPVFLLHGTDDSVIPAVESRLLARHLAGRTAVHLVVTPLITHVEPNRSPTLSEAADLIGFWQALFDG